MGSRAYLLCFLLVSVTITACGQSNQRDDQSMDRIDNSLAVVGRIFVYSLPKERENRGSFKVSDDLLAWC